VLPCHQISIQLSVSMGFAGATSSIHSGSISQPTGLEGSAFNVLESETTGHLQGCFLLICEYTDIKAPNKEPSFYEECDVFFSLVRFHLQHL